MYIEDKYWNHYIGDSDDSLTLIAYLADKQKEEISVSEIFSDIGIDKLNDIKTHEEPFTIVLKNMESAYEEAYVEFYYAIDIIGDLAALLLECKINGSVDLSEVDEAIESSHICITASFKEHQFINKTLKDFVSSPLDYDISETEDEEDMMEMAKIFGELRKELYG